MTLPLGWREDKTNDGQQMFVRYILHSHERMVVYQTKGNITGWAFQIEHQDGGVRMARDGFGTPELAAIQVVYHSLDGYRELIEQTLNAYGFLANEVLQLAHEPLKEPA